MTILMQIEIRLLITRESGTNTLSIEISKKNFTKAPVPGTPEHTGSCTCHDLFHNKRIKNVFDASTNFKGTKVRFFGTYLRPGCLQLALMNMLHCDLTIRPKN
jgi:hypothetical protein